MSTLSKRFSHLSVEKRALLEKMLSAKDINVHRALIIRRPEGCTRVPLSFAQQRLWFLMQMEPESTNYNVGNIFKVSGLVNVEAMERAFGKIVQRHEVLRTTFQEE